MRSNWIIYTKLLHYEIMNGLIILSKYYFVNLLYPYWNSCVEICKIIFYEKQYKRYELI